jgi:hypothetical protein
MRIAFALLIIVHGLIHILGFIKAFKIADVNQLSQSSSKSMGMLWLFVAILFLTSAVLYLLKKDWWFFIAISAIVFSQILIIIYWKDAKFGSIANVIILIAAIIYFASVQFENSYKKDVASAMEKNPEANEIITEKDLDHLPPIVQNYLHYAGVVGKPKVHNAKVVFEGEMRDKGKDGFKFTSEQYNFFEFPTRLFFMKAKVKGLPTHGYHAYKNEEASMQIKVPSLFSVVHIDKPELFPTETVTFFNDLCLFAPAALIDDRILWETIDDRSIKATFTNKDTSISAILHFNEKGQLVNFVSNDRIAIDQMKTFPFSTPASHYKNIGGYNLPTYGEAIWHYPDGEFVYGKFNLKSIEYNVTTK